MVLFKIAEGYVLKFNTAACNFPVGKRGIFIRQINGCLQNFCDTPVRGSCTRTLQNNVCKKIQCRQDLREIGDKCSQCTELHRSDHGLFSCKPDNCECRNVDCKCGDRLHQDHHPERSGAFFHEFLIDP